MADIFRIEVKQKSSGRMLSRLDDENERKLLSLFERSISGEYAPFPKIPKRDRRRKSLLASPITNNFSLTPEPNHGKEFNNSSPNSTLELQSPSYFKPLSNITPGKNPFRARVSRDWNASMASSGHGINAGHVGVTASRERLSPGSVRESGQSVGRVKRRGLQPSERMGAGGGFSPRYYQRSPFSRPGINARMMAVVNRSPNCRAGKRDSFSLSNTFDHTGNDQHYLSIDMNEKDDGTEGQRILGNPCAHRLTKNQEWKLTLKNVKRQQKETRRSSTKMGSAKCHKRSQSHQMEAFDKLQGAMLQNLYHAGSPSPQGKYSRLDLSDSDLPSIFEKSFF